jgi:hypothetical protein
MDTLSRPSPVQLGTAASITSSDLSDPTVDGDIIMVESGRANGGESSRTEGVPERPTKESKKAKISPEEPKEKGVYCHQSVYFHMRDPGQLIRTDVTTDVNQMVSVYWIELTTGYIRCTKLKQFSKHGIPRPCNIAWCDKDLARRYGEDGGSLRASGRASGSTGQHSTQVDYTYTCPCCQDICQNSICMLHE